MGTAVSLQVVGHQETEYSSSAAYDCLTRAEQWFRHIEAACSRFNPASEVRQLALHWGSPQLASALLIQAVQFALAVARESEGAFDPTVGQRMEARGFNRAYETGHVSMSAVPGNNSVTFRDVEVDADNARITLHKPLLLDLGAVAKGLAIDVAARELLPLQNFQINAGGDVYVHGHSPNGKAWRVGIRHPRSIDDLVETLSVSNAAVCTSGDYERSNERGEHHIMNARSGNSVNSLASVTVTAPSAMVADALATAAFALGPVAGMRFLKKQGVEALFVTPDLEKMSTAGLPVA